MKARCRIGLIVVALLLGGTAGCGSSANSRATAASSPTPLEPQPVTLHVGNLERTYYVLFPANRTERLPLVLALHGASQGVVELEFATRLNDKAASAGFVLAYPAGIGDSWNAGGCCGDAQARNIGSHSLQLSTLGRSA